ncbi:MAG: hypothetical protein ACR2MN_18335 [Acidimicrobiales bacterium]
MNRPRGLALIGLLTVLDGAWGAIVPFVGPLFGYRSHGQSAWQWSSLHGVLYLAPGVVAVLFGLIILARARAVTRGPVGFAGLVVAACGAWFVVGPALWPTFGTGPVFTPAATAMDNFVHQVGYNLGVGVILAMLGGMALKSLARDREIAVEGREPIDAVARREGAVGREPYVGDRHPVEPARRETMTPGSEPVSGRDPGPVAGREPVVGRDRVVEDGAVGRDRGPVAGREPVVGRDRGPVVGREPGLGRDRGSGATPTGVGNGAHLEPEGERARGQGGDGIPAAGIPADGVPEEGVPVDGARRRGLLRRFSR